MKMSELGSIGNLCDKGLVSKRAGRLCFGFWICTPCMVLVYCAFVFDGCWGWLCFFGLDGCIGAVRMEG